MTSLANVTGYSGIVYRVLAESNGSVVSRATFLDALYGVRAWGGSEWRSGRLAKAISHLRKRGARIYTHGRQGWALGVAPSDKVRPIGRNILEVLRNARGDVVPYERLIHYGWVNKPCATKRNVEVEIGRLRNYAQVDIQHVRGRGYKLIEAHA